MFAKFLYSVLLNVMLISTVLSARVLTESELSLVLNDASRTDSDRQRDESRKPDKILKFSGVAKGQNILDIYAGGGWYTELFSLAVGSDGHVYAHNDSLTWKFGGKEIEKRTENNRLKNVYRIDSVDIANIALRENTIDIAFMGINYHDLYFVSRVVEGEKQIMREGIVDYKKAFSTIKNVLKDDGVLIIIDHRALAGSGYQAANELHRIDPEVVKYEMQDVGFILVEEAFYLANPNDDLTRSVFNPDIRWNTDRFIYKFKKKI